MSGEYKSRSVVCHNPKVDHSAESSTWSHWHKEAAEKIISEFKIDQINKQVSRGHVTQQPVSRESFKDGDTLEHVCKGQKKNS